MLVLMTWRLKHSYWVMAMLMCSLVGMQSYFLLQRTKKSHKPKRVFFTFFIYQELFTKLAIIRSGLQFYTAAIGVVIGAIIEDIATFGVGISDDFATFALAWRIVRFARAL